MKTVALRFADNFAPKEGTIAAHRNIIDELGYVWYGKLGASVSDKVISEIMQNKEPKILLIHSGKLDRYWAYVEKVQHEMPPREAIPEYYRDNAGIFKTWFKVKDIKLAARNVLGQCVVASSQRPLADVSKSSMSPYFIIETKENT